MRLSRPTFYEPTARVSLTSGCETGRQFHAPADVDPDTATIAGSQGTDSVAAGAGDETQSASDEFEAEIKAMIDAQVQSAVTPLADENAALKKQLAEVQASRAATTNRLDARKLALQKVSKLYGGGAPSIRKGEDTMSSRGYEMQRAVGFTFGAPRFSREHCQQELQMSDWLKDRMNQLGYRQAGSDTVRQTVLIPMSLDALPGEIQVEFSQKFCNGRLDGLDGLMRQSVEGADPRAVIRGLIADAQTQRMSADDLADFQQTLGTLTTAAGGIFTDPAWNGEMIPLLLALGAHYRLGVTPGTLPAYGQDRLEREDSIPTAYMVGEGQAITDSQGSSGYVDFKAKKMAVKVPWNNELTRFGGPQTEARIRSGIARAFVVKEGALIHYGTSETSTSWAGVHNYAGRIDYTAAGTTQEGVTLGANGNTFDAEAVAAIPAYLADTSLLTLESERTAWFMRSGMHSNILNKRAGSGYAAADGAGSFLFHADRGDSAKGLPPTLGEFPVIRSAENLKTRAKGSSSVLTSVVFGCWNYIHVRRVGVMELAVSVQGDTYFANDQTAIRAIQQIDVKSTRENAFLVTDFIDQTA